MPERKMLRSLGKGCQQSAAQLENLHQQQLARNPKHDKTFWEDKEAAHLAIHVANLRMHGIGAV